MSDLVKCPDCSQIHGKEDPHDCIAKRPLGLLDVISEPPHPDWPADVLDRWSTLATPVTGPQPEPEHGACTSPSGPTQHCWHVGALTHGRFGEAVTRFVEERCCWCDRAKPHGRFAP